MDDILNNGKRFIVLGSQTKTDEFINLVKSHHSDFEHVMINDKNMTRQILDIVDEVMDNEFNNEPKIYSAYFNTTDYSANITTYIPNFPSACSKYTNGRLIIGINTLENNSGIQCFDFSSVFDYIVIDAKHYNDNKNEFRSKCAFFHPAEIEEGFYLKRINTVENEYDLILPEQPEIVLNI